MARAAKILGMLFDRGYLGGILFVLGALIAIPYDDDKINFDIGGWVALAGVAVFAWSRTYSADDDGGGADG